MSTKLVNGVSTKRQYEHQVDTSFFYFVDNGKVLVLVAYQSLQYQTSPSIGTCGPTLGDHGRVYVLQLGVESNLWRPPYCPPLH